jgi:DNA-binding response OmpR family regulator
MTMLKGPRMLYVDNDFTSSVSMRAWLMRHAPACTVVCVESGREALEHIQNTTFDLYLLEYCLGETTAPELCRDIRARDPHAPVVVCSYLERDVDRQMARDAGAEYFVKPQELHRLSATIRQHLGVLPRVRNRLFRARSRSAAII